MSGSFELTRTSNGKFMFNLKAGNGQVVLTSQMYESRASALQGIESVRVNAVLADRFERGTNAGGQPYFTLKAGNGQVIGRSQAYAGMPAMEGGIASVQSNAPDAALKDLTADA